MAVSHMIDIQNMMPTILDLPMVFKTAFRSVIMRYFEFKTIIRIPMTTLIN